MSTKATQRVLREVKALSENSVTWLSVRPLVVPGDRCDPSWQMLIKWSLAGVDE